MVGEVAAICYCCNAIARDSPQTPWISSMAGIKSGDLVVLKSGGPIMTVDTVNTDIFDDDKITGVLCVWFVGQKLERVRFDCRAIAPAPPQEVPPRKIEANAEEATGEYRVVLDDMTAAMNIPADAGEGTSRREIKRPKRAVAKHEAPTVSPVANGIAN
jgi:uncharacterized protein YodC (DUF2158 family)